MCGIAGVVDWGGRPVDPSLLRGMAGALRHRGPDDEGVWVQLAAPESRQAAAGLAHARLSIIDLAGGHQPLTDETEQTAIVFNGEIYNYRELRAELQAAGHVFRTRSDTEVILRAYAAHGTDCIARLRGMFALAVWDGARQRLLLARDRVGKKPLVYAQDGSRIVFASEIQALLQDPDLPRDVDWTSLHHYLTLLCIPAPGTAFRGILKLPPAHLAVVEQGQVRVQRYWHVAPAPQPALGEAQAAARLREHLEEAVRLRLISDVPVGAFLSGGLDSSIVVSAMAAQCAEPVRTFTVGFERDAFNERPFARLACARYRTAHTEEVVAPEAAAIMPGLIRHYGEPFADASAIPTYYLAACARRAVKVVLSGDGGDELFGGYRRHLAMRWADRYAALPLGLRRGGLDALLAAWPQWLDVRRGRVSLRRFLRGLPLPRRDRLLAWLCGFDEAAKRAGYAAAMRSRVDGADTGGVLDAYVAPAAGLDGVNALTWIDFQWYLPSDLLVKVDIAAMAHGLEVRCPWLDHPLVEFALRLPSSLKVRGRTLKYLPRRAWRRELPPAILARGKQGFAVPLAEWLRGPLREWMDDLLRSPRARSRGIMTPAMTESLVAAHVGGRQDRSEQLWALMMLELWFRQVVEASREVPAAC